MFNYITFEELFNESIQENEEKFLYYRKSEDTGLLELKTGQVSLYDYVNLSYDEALVKFKDLVTDLFSDVCELNDINNIYDNEYKLNKYANLIAQRTRRGRGTTIIDNKVLLYHSKNAYDNAVLVVKKNGLYNIAISPNTDDRVLPSDGYGVKIKYL